LYEVLTETVYADFIEARCIGLINFRPIFVRKIAPKFTIVCIHAAQQLHQARVASNCRPPTLKPASAQDVHIFVQTRAVNYAG